jgi:hypothetical protein
MRAHVRDMYFGVSNLLFKGAEELRKYCTWEEEVIWGHPSRKNLGVQFRR